MKILEKVRKQLMSLVLLGALGGTAAAEAGETLNVFQITQGYNDGLIWNGNNLEYFGLDFRNKKMAAVWMDNSGTITSTPPAPVSNLVFASVQVNSPQDIVVGPNVVISKNLNFIQAEPSLAIDPRNTNNITVAAGNYINPRPFNEATKGLLVASTIDGGKSWKTNGLQNRNNFQPNTKNPIPTGYDTGDLHLSYDSQGNLLFVYLSTFPPNQDFFLDSPEFPAYANLCVSTDHGKSFKAIKTFDPSNYLPNAVGFDFPELAVGRDQVAIGPKVFNSNTEFLGTIFIFPIKGKGKFGSPTLIKNPTGSTNRNGYGTMAFSPAGGLLVAQTDYNSNSHQSSGVIYTSFLPKGAKEFPAATAVQPFKNVGVGGGALYPPQFERGTWSQTKIAYVYNGHHYGRVYMAYIDNPNVPGCPLSCSTSYGVTCPGYPHSITPGCDTGWANTNVYIVYSDNDGKTWSTPFAIPKGGANPTNTRFNVSLAIDQTTGNIGVASLDAVNDPADIKVQVFGTVIPWDFFD